MLGVTHIINCAIEIRNFYPDDFQYLNLHLQDWEDQQIAVHFEKAYQFIEDARNKNGKVLVHCMAGVSRSSTITISYVMKFKNMNLKESFSFTKQKRACIYPNTGFLHQLIKYEQTLFQNEMTTVDEVRRLDFKPIIPIGDGELK